LLLDISAKIFFETHVKLSNVKCSTIAAHQTSSSMPTLVQMEVHASSDDDQQPMDVSPVVDQMEPSRQERDTLSDAVGSVISCASQNGMLAGNHGFVNEAR
jgi:hypothetical protein